MRLHNEWLINYHYIQTYHNIVTDNGPYAKKGTEGKVRTARKGWRGKSLL